MTYHTRLTRKQKAKDTRRALIFIILTLILALALVFIGIPLLIRMAIFLGNLRTSSKIPEKSDLIPPSPPRIIVPFEATNSAQLFLKGHTEPGAAVELYNSGLSSTKVVADANGLFIVEDFTLTSGRNELTAIAQDEAGNQSQTSTPVVINYDTSPPSIEITNPEEGITISGLQNQVAIEGKTEENAKLTINDRLVIIGPEGNFHYQVSLQEGDNIFTLIVQDEAGNQTEKELKINYSP